MNNLAYQVERKQAQTTQKTAVIVEKGNITKGEVLLLTFLAITFFLAAIFAISNYTAIYSVHSDIQTLQSEIDRKTVEVEDLKLQVAALSEPDRIVDIAKNELGLELNEKNVKVITE